MEETAQKIVAKMITEIDKAPDAYNRGESISHLNGFLTAMQSLRMCGGFQEIGKPAPVLVSGAGRTASGLAAIVS